MGEGKIQMHRDAESIDKLVKPPLAVDIGIYELDPENNQDVRLKETVPAYLHRLTWLEQNHVRAANSQVYKFSKANGADEDEARTAVMQVSPRMLIYFALKQGVEKTSTRFFQTQEQLMAYPYEQAIWELYQKYLNEFSLDEVEWGNLLRARSLGTSSVLPNSSKGQGSSEPNLQN